MSKNYETLKKEYTLIDPNVIIYNGFIDTFCGNTFKYFVELFQPEINTFIPTGTCPPFGKKVFLTVNGKVFPCEKIGNSFPLGQVTEDAVEIDFTKICDLYAGFYSKIIDCCKQCIIWNNCGQCIYTFEEENNQAKCPIFWAKKEAGSYYSRFLSYAEENPDLYQKIFNEIMVD